MPTSNATVTVTQMELTPCRVTFDGVDFGGTLGNVVVSFKYDKAEIKADQLGTTVLDRRVSGMMTQITTEFAEIQNKDKFKQAFPNLDLVTSGPNKLLRMANKLGSSDYDLSKVLILHPLSKADADLSQDWKFFKATPSEESEITFSPTDQMRAKIVWNIYPDQGVSGYPMWVKGDPAVGLIAASAAAAVAGGGNTGNGTVGSIAAYSGFTLTETITLECVGVPAADQANFSVTGSLSGPLGIAELGIAFVSPQISFTIADGATDFVVGDTFTIATTAANYV